MQIFCASVPHLTTLQLWWTRWCDTTLRCSRPDTGSSWARWAGSYSTMVPLVLGTMISVSHATQTGANIWKGSVTKSWHLHNHLYHQQWQLGHQIHHLHHTPTPTPIWECSHNTQVPTVRHGVIFTKVCRVVFSEQGNKFGVCALWQVVQTPVSPPTAVAILTLY